MTNKQKAIGSRTYKLTWGLPGPGDSTSCTYYITLCAGDRTTGAECTYYYYVADGINDGDTMEITNPKDIGTIRYVYLLHENGCLDEFCFSYEHFLYIIFIMFIKKNQLWTFSYYYYYFFFFLGTVQVDSKKVTIGPPFVLGCITDLTGPLGCTYMAINLDATASPPGKIYSSVTQLLCDWPALTTFSPICLLPKNKQTNKRAGTFSPSVSPTKMPTTQSPTKAPVIAGDGVFQCTTSYTYTIDDPTVQDSQVASIVYSAVMAVYKDAKIDSKVSIYNIYTYIYIYICIYMYMYVYIKNIALLQTGDGKHEQKRDNNTNDRRGECRTGDLGSVQREERRHPDEFECEAKSRQRLAEDARLKQKRDEFRRNELKKQEKLDLQVQANVVPISVEGLDTGVAASTDADRKLSSAQTSEESSTEDSQHDPVDP
ncbi:hypothetical protein RFI_17863, partial [Reticulomyxa filosa]